MLSSFAFGQETKAEIWSPNMLPKDQHIKLTSWGSGNISQTSEVAHDGAYSIRVSTNNYFQGGIIHFGDAKDVSKYYADSTNLLQITVRTADQLIMHSTVETDNPASQGGGGGGKFGGKLGAPKTANTTEEKVEASKNGLSRVRMIVSTTDGKKSEVYLPLPVSAHNPWHAIAIPLQDITGFDKTNKMIDGLAFSGDATSTYYIGDIRLIHDATDITGEMNAKKPMNLALNDTVEFKGSGDGGSTILKYSWCFDSANGFFEDARGADVKHKFRKAGKYLVTLMVSDYYGAKKPFTVSDEITVNP
jgi:hypothetical protein